MAIYNQAYDAVVGFSPSATMSVRWGGYGVVVAIVTAHLVLILVTTTTFLRATSFSRLGDFWNVFAQSYVDQVRSVVFEQVQDVSDANVKEWISGKQ